MKRPNTRLVFYGTTLVMTGGAGVIGADAFVGRIANLGFLMLGAGLLKLFADQALDAVIPPDDDHPLSETYPGSGIYE